MYPLTIEEVTAYLFVLGLDEDRFLSYQQIDKYANIVMKILAEKDFKVRLDFGRNNTWHMLYVYSDFFSEVQKNNILGIELSKNITKENLYNTFCSYLDLKVAEAFEEITRIK